MSSAADPSGTVETALAHAGRLLADNPAMALEQAQEILKVAPNHPVATLLMGKAQRGLGDLETSVRTLRALADGQHQWAAAHYELGCSLGEEGQHEPAVRALRRALELKPDLPDAWRALGDMLTITGDRSGADSRLCPPDPDLDPRSAAAGRGRGPGGQRDTRAETLLRVHLLKFPTDVAALRMLAEVGARLGAGFRRRAPAGALPRARAQLQRRAPQLRIDPAPAQ